MSLNLTEARFRELFPHATESTVRKNFPLGLARAAEVGKTEVVPEEGIAFEDDDYATKPKKRAKSPNGYSESRMQQTLVRWWGMACVEFGLPVNALCAFPLQGLRTARNGARLKAEGMRKGFPDLALFVPTAMAPALFVELKTQKGRLTPAQKEMLGSLESRGYSTAVCRSFDEAEGTIREFLKWRKPAA